MTKLRPHWKRFLLGTFALFVVTFTPWYRSSLVNNATERYLGRSSDELERKLIDKGFHITSKRTDGWYTRQGRTGKPVLSYGREDELNQFCKSNTCEIKAARKTTPYLFIVQKLERMIWVSVQDEIKFIDSEHFPQRGNI